MGTRTLLHLLACGAVLGAGPRVEEKEKPKPKEPSATVTVTAEASPVELAKTPNTVRIFDAEALSRSGARTLAELLAQAFPGQILTLGGLGTAATLSLGGTRTQDVVVTLDGIRLTEASGLGSVNLSSVSLVGIDRVEVQLGPCSPRLGSGAMGGAISLLSGGPRARGLAGELRGSLGTRGHRRLNLDSAFGWEGGWVRLGGEGLEEQQATPTPKPFRTGGVNVQAGQQLGHGPGGEHLLTATYRNTFVGVPIPWAAVSPTTRTYLDERETNTRQEQAILSLKSAFGPRWTSQFSLGLAQQDRMEASFTDGKPNQPYRSRRGQFLGQVAWTGEGRSVAFMVDGHQESGRTPAFPGGTDKGEGSHLALGVEGAWEPAPALRLTAILRHQWDKQGYVNADGSPLPKADSEATTGRVGANVTVPGEVFSGQLRVYASAAKAFSLPILTAVMYNQQNGGTADLGVERSTNLQAGAGWSAGPWSLGLELSRTAYTDLIYFDLNTFTYAAGQHLRVQGAELRAAYAGTGGGVTGFYRNQEARAEDQPAHLQLRDGAVIRRPFQTLGVTGFRDVGAFRGELAWTWVGPRYENFGGFPAKLGASKVHVNDLALGLTWRRSDAFAVSLKGEHLLQPTITKEAWKARTTDGDNDAYYVFGFPAQPPVLRLEARYRF